MVTGRGFWAQLGLHGLVGGTTLLVGIAIGLDGTLGTDAAELALLVPGALALVAGAAAAALLGRRRVDGWGRERAAREAAEAKAEHLARHDALTGLLNRAVFAEHLHQVVSGSRRHDRMVALLCVDLTDFRGINGTLGHAAGDLLLRHAAARLLAALRDTDVVARLGADEFAILQSEPAGAASAASLCERLLRALEEPFDLHGHQVFVGASIGVAFCPTDGPDPLELLRNAGLALDRAKADGGHGYRFFEEGMDADVRHRKALERDLCQALERGEFELHYQPQFDLATRRPVGVEALLHWRHPVHGRIGPEIFVPLAEDTGLIVPIGAWVLEEACTQGVRWHAAGASGLRVAVNLSPVQFRHPDLAGLIADVLARTGFPAAALELEITERVLMEHTEANLATLERLRRQGVRISIDDFGVGHSSLAYLHRFPFDEVKIDRSFVCCLDDDQGAAAIVRATLTLGRSLHMQTVAEGVETAEQLAFLGTEGCNLAQGYFFSPPVPVQEIDSLVRAADGAAPDAADEAQPVATTGA